MPSQFFAVLHYESGLLLSVYLSMRSGGRIFNHMLRGKANRVYSFLLIGLSLGTDDEKELVVIVCEDGFSFNVR